MISLANGSKQVRRRSYLRSDVSKRLDNNTADHQVVAANRRRRRNDDRPKTVDDIAIQKSTSTANSIGQNASEEDEHSDHEVLRRFQQSILRVVDVKLLQELSVMLMEPD
jgi:hypothetical protein